MSDEELYAQYLAETGQAQPAAQAPQDPLYAQYLAETGQAAEPVQNVAEPRNAGAENFSSGESALQGFGSGATFGYLPRAQAAVEAALDPELTYAQALPHWQKREADIIAEDPLTFTGGALTGSMAMPIPGTTAIKAGGIGSKMLKAGAQGAAMAGASDTGEDVGSMVDLSARLERAKFGGLLGAGLQGAGSAIAKSGDKLKEYGVFKLLGARGKDAEKLLEKNKAGLKRTEEFLDQEGIVGPLTTSAGLSKKVDKIANETGKEIGDVYSKVQAEGLGLLTLTPLANTPEGAAKVQRAMQTRLEPKRLADEFMSKATMELEGTANGNQVLASLKSQLDNLRKVKTEKGIDGVVDFRKSLDDVLKKSYEKPAADLGENQQALMTLRRYLKDRTTEHIKALDDLAGTDASRKLVKLNDRFSNASTVRRITNKTEVAQMRNNMFGLPELLVGGGAIGGGLGTMMSGDVEGGLQGALRGAAAAATYKLGRTYGPGMSYNIGRGLQRIPAMPVKSVIAPWMLMNKGDQK